MSTTPNVGGRPAIPNRLHVRLYDETYGALQHEALTLGGIAIAEVTRRILDEHYEEQTIYLFAGDDTLYLRRGSRIPFWVGASDGGEWWRETGETFAQTAHRWVGDERSPEDGTGDFRGTLPGMEVEESTPIAKWTPARGVVLLVPVAHLSAAARSYLGTLPGAEENSTTDQYGAFRDGGSLTVTDWLAGYCGDFADEYDLEAAEAAVRDRINELLPEGVSLAGDQLYGPAAYQQHVDLGAVLEAVPLDTILEQHAKTGSRS